MNENRKIDLNLNTADLRKAAFAIGFGLTVGKFVGACVNGAIQGCIEYAHKNLAKSETKKD